MPLALPKPRKPRGTAPTMPPATSAMGNASVATPSAFAAPGPFPSRHELNQQAHAAPPMNASAAGTSAWGFVEVCVGRQELEHNAIVQRVAQHVTLSDISELIVPTGDASVDNRWGCLPRALHALGYQVFEEGSPETYLWALRDGNRFLVPHGAALSPCAVEPYDTGITFCTEICISSQREWSTAEMLAERPSVTHNSP